MASVGIICDRELLKPMDQRVWKQATSIKKMGYDVEIITPHHKTYTRTMQKIKIHCIEKSKLPGITALNLIIKTLKGKYDILHCHEFNPLLYTIILKKLTNSKIIWDCHEDYPSLISTKINGNGLVKENKNLGSLINLLIKLAIRNVDTVLTITPPLVKRYRKYKKTLILPNFPPSNLFNKNLKNDDIKRRYANKQVLIYQGGIKRGRGMGLILSSLDIVKREIPDLVFVVLGGEIEKTGWSNESEKFLVDHNDSIITTGWVDYDKMAPYLAQADLGIIMNRPTHYNNRIGLPNKLFEYLACGLPVISSNLPEIKKIIERNECGIILDSEEPKKIAKSIIDFFSNKNKKKVITEKSNNISSKYSWERCEKILDFAYNS